ncbi:hypothetical protein TcCL_ESM06838 [Trypanosoma cruzi]|nr:hypothetical protein TcCL_ESM06838 [Trypanosoma cruzi]
MVTRERSGGLAVRQHSRWRSSLTWVGIAQQTAAPYAQTAHRRRTNEEVQWRHSDTGDKGPRQSCCRCLPSPPGTTPPTLSPASSPPTQQGRNSGRCDTCEEHAATESHCCRHGQTRSAARRKKKGKQPIKRFSITRKHRNRHTRRNTMKRAPKPKLLQQIHREAKKNIMQAQKKATKTILKHASAVSINGRGAQQLWHRTLPSSNGTAPQRTVTTACNDDD